jgi:hypothetical protein
MIDLRQAAQAMIDLRQAARALGGDIAGRDQVRCPGPGHSPRGRSLAVRFVTGDFIVHSFANNDWRACRDHVRARLGWDTRRPATKPAPMRATPPTPDDTVDRIGRARSLWRATVPAKGTLAERYLIETRRSRQRGHPLSPTPEVFSQRRVSARHGLRHGGYSHQRIHRHSSDVLNGGRPEGGHSRAGPQAWIGHQDRSRRRRGRRAGDCGGGREHDRGQVRLSPGMVAYLERDADADQYQGHSYTRLYVEEIGNFPSSAPIFSS